MIAFAWALQNWRILAAGVAATAVIGSVGYVTHLRHEAALARTKAEVAEQGREIAHEAVQSQDRHTAKTKAVHQQAESEVDAIQSTPGADTPLNADRRNDLCAALSRMRNNAPACAD